MSEEPNQNQTQKSLRITEIFYSLQGESTFVGLPTVFIRLTGCPLRCQYCDTAYAFKGGKKLSILEILEQVKTYKTKYICVTGGEPLAQKACLDLLKILADENFTVSLETSGALPIDQVDPRITIILDIKTPGSLESDKNYWPNLKCLKKSDQIKFVICSREDYEFSKKILLENNLLNFCEILFSPSYTQVKAEDLAAWILEDQLLVRLQIQLHKFLWGNKTGV